MGGGGVAEKFEKLLGSVDGAERSKMDGRERLLSISASLRALRKRG